VSTKPGLTRKSRPTQTGRSGDKDRVGSNKYNQANLKIPDQEDFKIRQAGRARFALKHNTGVPYASDNNLDALISKNLEMTEVCLGLRDS
jgi:hypothetical protein